MRIHGEAIVHLLRIYWFEFVSLLERIFIRIKLYRYSFPNNCVRTRPCAISNEKLIKSCRSHNNQLTPFESMHLSPAIVPDINFRLTKINLVLGSLNFFLENLLARHSL